MRLININGPINSGKTTISKMLVKEIPNAELYEIDALVSWQEVQDKKLEYFEAAEMRLSKFDNLLIKTIQSGQNDIIVSYPLDEKNYLRWTSVIKNKAEFISITLAPQREVFLKDRGTRDLNDNERLHINEMYDEGYASPKNTDLIIDNSKQTPEETLRVILDYLNKTDM